MNIVLDWYPDKPAYNYLDETDFLYWSHYWNNQKRSNRIVMIHDVGWMLPYSDSQPVPHSDKYLLKAIHEHMSYVVGTLKKLIDIELQSEMYFEYRSLSVPSKKSPWEVERDELISCEILSVAEIKERENQKWLIKTFEELEMSADDFVKMFADAEGKNKRFVKNLKAKGIKRLGEMGAANIINKLKKEFPEIYLRNYPEEMMKIDRKVVSISVKRPVL
jgi:hypothetical protein